MYTYFYLLFVFFSHFSLIPRISSFFQAKFDLFLRIFPLLFRYPLYCLYFIFPSYCLNYFSLHLFSSLHIFKVSFFFFSLHFSLLYFTLPLCISLPFHYFPIYSFHFLRIFFFFVVISPLLLFLTAVLPVLFFPSTTTVTHDKSKYVFFSFKIYPHTNETLDADISNRALCLIYESCGV